MRMSYLAAAAAVFAGVAPFSTAFAQLAGDAAHAREADGINPEVARRGDTVDGRWIGGQQAPGGWAAYRLPTQGEVLPAYWSAPSFRIRDGARYGLPAPRSGNGWYRYYDVAVLLDRDGRVQDYRRGIDWSGRNPRSYRTGYPVVRPARVAGAAPVLPAVLAPGAGYTTTTTRRDPAGGYVANGYYYPPRTVTTITIHPPVLASAEEVVTYSTDVEEVTR